MMRNKFMFHIKNYDDFSFIFEENISEKEDLLCELFKSIKNEIDIVVKLLKKTSIINKYSNLLNYYPRYFDECIDFYKSKKWGDNATVDNSQIYNALPRYFAMIAASYFLLFFGKEDLNLFDKDNQYKAR